MFKKALTPSRLLGLLFLPGYWAFVTLAHSDPAQYVGPGSLGNFTTVSVNPQNPNFLLAGADVGGVYLSADGGNFWKSVNLNLPVQGVFGAAYSITSGESPTLRIVLGTESGIYYSNDITLPITTCGTTGSCNVITGWTEADGLERLDLSYAKSHTSKKLADGYPHDAGGLDGNTRVSPIGVVTVDPNDPETLWAGVGRYGVHDQAVDREYKGVAAQRFDSAKVYRSTDRGANWTAMLRFSAPGGHAPFFAGDTDAIDTADYANEDDDGNVFGILVPPQDADTVLVSTDHGLYRGEQSFEGETELWSWIEIGTEARRSTDNGGDTWDTSLTPGCEDFDSADTAPPTSWCLPTVGSAWTHYVIGDTGEVSDYHDTAPPEDHSEQHPNLRDVGATLVTVITGIGPGQTTVTSTRLYVAAWDLGYAEGLSGCSDGVGYDTGMDHYRGGIYASDDLGETWKWLFTDDGSPTGTPLLDSGDLAELQYRCEDDASQRASDRTFAEFGSFSAAPGYTINGGAKPGAPVLVASAYGDLAGFFTYRIGPSTDWRVESDKVGSWTNWEGGTPYNISEQPDGSNHAPNMGEVVATWNGMTPVWPMVYLFGGPRGIIKGTWAGSSYFFWHAGSVNEGTDGDGRRRWSGAGLDDACVFAAMEAGSHLFVGTSDAGTLRADANLKYVDIGAYEWQVNGCSDTGWDCEEDYPEAETRAIAARPSGVGPWIVYAGNFTDNGGTEVGSILKSGDDGESWSVIGGSGYDTGSGLNGLEDDDGIVKVLALEAVSGDYESGVELLAGGKNGLYAYDGSTWEALCASDTLDGDTGLSTKRVSDLAIDEDLVPGYAFAAVPSNGPDSLILIDLDDLSCASMNPISGGTDPEVEYVTAVEVYAEEIEEEPVPYVVVGGTSTTTATAYQHAYIAPLDTADPDVESWDTIISLKDYIYTEGPSYFPTALPDTGEQRSDLWTHALKQFGFSSFAVNPDDKTDLWLAIDGKPYFDYVNNTYVFEWDGTTDTLGVYNKEDLGLPNGAIKTLSFETDPMRDELYVGSCTSLYRLDLDTL